MTDTLAARRLGAPFWRFWTSAAAVNVADGIRAAALPLIAASVSDNAFGVALITACQQGAWLVFGLGAGLVADRYPPARVVAAADALRVVMLSALLVVLLLDAVTIPLLAGTAFVIGVAETFRDTASHSILPRLVTEAQLERANGRLIGTEIVGNEFIGPLLGALLFAAAVSVPVAVDATALLIAAVLVLTLPKAASTVAVERPDGKRPPLRTELLGGVRWLLGNPRLAAVTCSGAAICFADSAWWSVLVVYSGNVLGLPEAGFGLLLAAGAVGGTAGALGAERLAERFAPHTVLVTGTLLSGLPAVVIALSDSPYVAAAMLAVSSGGFALWNVVALSTRQREAPREVLGRVTGTHRIVLYGSGMVGALAGGAIADALTLTAPFHVAGALVTVAAAGLLVVFLRERGTTP
ncbi:MFS transporter [Streptomyces glaucosporus]|uniref:MFS transporter n=1 Tax=Streptomyces glaucosporus TaxID=284044 RepID=UPI0031DD1392